jgi:hypothetical protein
MYVPSLLQHVAVTTPTTTSTDMLHVAPRLVPSVAHQQGGVDSHGHGFHLKLHPIAVNDVRLLEVAEPIEGQPALVAALHLPYLSPSWPCF